MRINLLYLLQVFESHDIDAIASKVVSMQQSLKVLASSVDYEERRLQLEGFKNRLEAIASPPLVKAFTNNNISEGTCLKIYISSILKRFFSCILF